MNIGLKIVEMHLLSHSKMFNDPFNFISKEKHSIYSNLINIYYFNLPIENYMHVRVMLIYIIR